MFALQAFKISVSDFISDLLMSILFDAGLLNSFSQKSGRFSQESDTKITAFVN